MFIITNDHLEKLRKALRNSNSELTSVSSLLEGNKLLAFKKTADKTIKKNNEMIDLINSEYLEIKADYDKK